jgi:hypothetical protein
MKKTPLFKSLVFSLLSVFSTVSYSGEIYNQLPETIDKDKGYVFYSHGYIVEGDNPTPVDERFGWGLYDFPKIKEALSDDSYTLIATHREKDTNPYRYATELSMQVRQLVDQGVNPKKITIMGFSRGAFITGLTSDKLSDLGVNTIIMAGCGRLISKGHMDIKVFGHVLSIYEKSDRANTCEKLKEKSADLDSFEEIEINTGLEHGAFYRPISQWVDPVKAWIKTKHAL